jgi:hypothetical protein
MDDSKISPKVMKGGCLCGKIRYQTTGEPKYSGLCYCGDCRKSSGSAFVGFMGFACEDFKVDGTDKTRSFYGKSSTGGERAYSFCVDCGSHLFGGIYGKDKEHTVYVGSLDSEFVGDFEPKMALFTGQRPEWGKLKCEMTEYETMP